MASDGPHSASSSISSASSVELPLTPATFSAGPVPPATTSTKRKKAPIQLQEIPPFRPGPKNKHASPNPLHHVSFSAYTPPFPTSTSPAQQQQAQPRRVSSAYPPQHQPPRPPSTTRGEFPSVLRRRPTIEGEEDVLSVTSGLGISLERAPADESTGLNTLGSTSAAASPSPPLISPPPTSTLAITATDKSSVAVRTTSPPQGTTALEHLASAASSALSSLPQTSSSPRPTPSSTPAPVSLLSPSSASPILIGFTPTTPADEELAKQTMGVKEAQAKLIEWRRVVSGGPVSSGSGMGGLEGAVNRLKANTSRNNGLGHGPAPSEDRRASVSGSGSVARGESPPTPSASDLARRRGRVSDLKVQTSATPSSPSPFPAAYEMPKTAPIIRSQGETSVLPPTGKSTSSRREREERDGGWEDASGREGKRSRGNGNGANGVGSKGTPEWSKGKLLVGGGGWPSVMTMPSSSSSHSPEANARPLLPHTHSHPPSTLSSTSGSSSTNGPAQQSQQPQQQQQPQKSRSSHHARGHSLSVSSERHLPPPPSSSSSYYQYQSQPSHPPASSSSNQRFLPPSPPGSSRDAPMSAPPSINLNGNSPRVPQGWNGNPSSAQNHQHQIQHQSNYANSPQQSPYPYTPSPNSNSYHQGYPSNGNGNQQVGAGATKQAFLGLFSTFYDSLADSRVLSGTLNNQIGRSATLLNTLQESTAVLEHLVDKRLAPIEDRMVGIEEHQQQQQSRSSSDSSKKESLEERLDRLERRVEELEAEKKTWLATSSVADVPPAIEVEGAKEGEVEGDKV